MPNPPMWKELLLWCFLQDREDVLKPVVYHACHLVVSALIVWLSRSKLLSKMDILDHFIQTSQTCLILSVANTTRQYVCTAAETAQMPFQSCFNLKISFVFLWSTYVSHTIQYYMSECLCSCFKKPLFEIRKFVLLNHKTFPQK